jgi:hypothetical protein
MTSENQKNDQTEQAPTNPQGSGFVRQGRKLHFQKARREGEHLGCSPCGKVAGREQCHRLALPGGAAVALAESALDYTFY